MDNLVARQVFASPPSSPSLVNERTEVRFLTSTKADSQEGTDLPLLSLSCVFLLDGGWSRTGRIPRNHLSFHLFSSTTEGRPGLRKSKQRRDKGGSGNEPEGGGVTEALCDSAPLSYIMQMGTTCTGNHRQRGICVDTLHKDLKWTSDRQVP